MKKNSKINISYDNEVDAVYISLTSDNKIKIKNTYTCDELKENLGGDINLDFDQDGRLVGIEIINASNVLHKELLE